MQNVGCRSQIIQEIWKRCRMLQERNILHLYAGVAEFTKYVAVSGIVLLLIIYARLQKEQWLLKRTLQIPWAF